MDSKRITRSRIDRMLGGVASGLALYLGVDPTLVRLAFIVLSLLNGFGALLYITLWLIVPNEGALGTGRTNLQEALGEMQAAVENLVARVRAAFQRYN